MPMILNMASEISSTSITLHGFTPVRRRDSTVNTRQFHGDQEKEWTAARCHRLLRALTSRVAILNKDLSRLSQARQAQSRNNGEVPPTAKTLQQNNQDKDDGDWTLARKKLKRTYSNRIKGNGIGQRGEVPKTPRISASSKGRKSMVPGEILVPTPILARARGELDVDDHPSMTANAGLCDLPIRRPKRSKHHHTTNEGHPSFQLSGTLREMRQKTNASRYTIYEGIYNGLEALLRSTMRDEPVTKGARSLFSMSLRAIPSYIAEEEAHLEETGTKSAIDTRDISTEIYDELEDFGTSGYGWKQLKVIVRSHGTKVIGDAITAGLIDVEFCGVLVTLCIHTFAAEEAEVLLSSLLSSSHFPAPKNLYDFAPRPFSMLWKFVEYTGRFAFQYQQLASLISKGVLPLGWLATKEFRPVWIGVMQRLSPGSVNSDALMFLETTLPLLARSGQSSNTLDTSSFAILKPTFSSLITTLLSIVLLSREATESCVDERPAVSDAPYEHVTTLLQSCVIQYDLSPAPNNTQGALLFAANLIARQQIGKCTESENSLVKLLQDQTWEGEDDSDVAPASYNDLVAFICSVARCCGRGASSVGFEYLKYLHLTLVNLSIDGPGVDIFQGVIVDSAFAFAQQLPEQTHLDYASTLDVKFSDRKVKHELAPVSEASNDARPGFRWEEGIGEWVMATPAGNNSKRDSIARYPLKEDECDSPFQPPPRTRLNKTKEVAPVPKKRNLRSSNVSMEPADSSDVPDYSDSVLNVLHFEMNAAASDDELHTSFPCNDDSFESGSMSGSISVGLASDVEMSFPQTSLSSGESLSEEETEYKHSRRSIDRAPRLCRNELRSSQDWQLFDKSFSSIASSSTSDQTRDVNSRRQYVDRAPRLGRRALRSSQAWQLFDESDDELSFLSVSSQSDQVLGDITNTATTKNRSARRTRAATKSRKSIANWTTPLSEDELGI
ncbi:hypothetical protein LCER1_G007287 [Lachnellula cervina]|uniref:Uncharacterized protein n=1 Tax=Lachnellula cervina TaxID=1316786 RepID=A0A7D8YJ71_9HELO|nr:hypothetical protein LCER1_G007287 [Lachnellula cervina]